MQTTPYGALKPALLAKPQHGHCIKVTMKLMQVAKPCQLSAILVFNYTKSLTTALALPGMLI